MLNNYDKEVLLKSFPNIELSYGTIIHNKVQNFSFVLLIPEGTKCFAWFTVFKNQNVCILMDLNEFNKIVDIKIVYCCFDNKLSYGTIFYGTSFVFKKQNFFSIQDIKYYKGKNISNNSYSDKLNIFYDIFNNEIKQISYVNSSIVFGLPIISDNLNEKHNLPYKIKYIQFRINSKNKSNFCFNLPYNENIYTKSHKKNNTNFTKEFVFQVKPDLQNDIYYLYIYNENNILYLFDTAYIPDYKTSVMMNKLFRIIKENDNLDALEESDDEEEFQNNNIDKFVHLNKTVNMICIFNNKFKKWAPIKEANNSQKIISKNDLIRLENNKY